MLPEEAFTVERVARPSKHETATGTTKKKRNTAANDACGGSRTPPRPEPLPVQEPGLNTYTRGPE